MFAFWLLPITAFAYTYTVTQPVYVTIYDSGITTFSGDDGSYSTKAAEPTSAPMAYLPSPRPNGVPQGYTQVDFVDASGYDYTAARIPLNFVEFYVGKSHQLLCVARVPECIVSKLMFLVFLGYTGSMSHVVSYSDDIACIFFGVDGGITVFGKAGIHDIGPPQVQDRGACLRRIQLD